MTNLILDLLIMISLGSIVFILVKALPRVDDSKLANSEIKTPWIVSYIEEVDERFNVFLEKFLRRTRLLTLKMDNSLSSKLNSFKKREKNSKLEFELDLEMKETEDGIELSETVIIEEKGEISDFDSFSESKPTDVEGSDELKEDN
ncbi:MAG: hypothetical protein WDZ80_00645 [Candidatus Paceibacterota bacterium]